MTAAGDDLQTRFGRIRAIAETVGAERVLYFLYDKFYPAKPIAIASDDAALTELHRHVTELPAILPGQHPELLKLSQELGLHDIEDVVLYASALRQRSGETVWFHYSLALALNRLLLAGVEAARTPCLLHSLLGLQYRGGGRHHEPALHSLIAREAAELAPRDAIQEGIEALMLGNPGPFETIVGAARSLGMIEENDQPRGQISFLQEIARRCGLNLLQDLPPTATASGIAQLKVEAVIKPERRQLPRPEPDGFYYLFRGCPQEVEVPSVSVYEIPQGIISFDVTQRGLTEFYVFDSEGRCLEDLSHGIRPFILEDVDTVAGPLAVVGDKYSGTMNLSHFLLDQLTKLAVYKKYLGDIPRFVLPDDHPYYHSVLSIAGLAELALIPRQKQFSIRSDRLLIASNIEPDLRHPAHLGASWALDFLRELLPTGPPEGSRADRKIFISRADARARKIINQQEIEAIVSRRGYDIVVPGEMTAREQMRVFGEASHVVGVHGAGLTNVLFCAPGARVLEILPALCAAPTYWVLSTQIGHRYHAVVADDPELPRPDYSTWSHRVEYNNRNLVLPAERLMAALEAIDGRLDA
jgi:hypothetical protein